MKDRHDSPSYRLHRNYQAALLHLGYPCSTPIEEVSLSFFYKEGKEISLIRHIKSFYERLGKKEKEFFRKECLEIDSHYKFWYLLDYHRLDIERVRAELDDAVAREFSC